jgi:hypothetical protein
MKIFPCRKKSFVSPFSPENREKEEKKVCPARCGLQVERAAKKNLTTFSGCRRRTSNGIQKVSADSVYSSFKLLSSSGGRGGGGGSKLSKCDPPHNYLECFN